MNKIQNTLKIMHDHLMWRNIPFHCVSVVHHPESILFPGTGGFFCYFTESVKHMVDLDMVDFMNIHDFKHSFVKALQDKE